MANKTLFERTGITIGDLEAMYEEEGSIDRVANRVGCSRPTVIKYLRHVKKDRTPWKTKTNGPIHPLASLEWKQEVFNQIEHAILNKKVWMDMEQRKIPMQFIRGIYFELPDYTAPVVPLYTVLRDGTKTVLLHIVKELPRVEEKEPEVESEPLALHQETPGEVRDPSDHRRSEAD
jgi:hypothetical protein